MWSLCASLSPGIFLCTLLVHSAMASKNSGSIFGLLWPLPPKSVHKNFHWWWCRKAVQLLGPLRINLALLMHSLQRETHSALSFNSFCPLPWDVCFLRCVHSPFLSVYRLKDNHCIGSKHIYKLCIGSGRLLVIPAFETNGQNYLCKPPFEIPPLNYRNVLGCVCVRLLGGKCSA